MTKTNVITSDYDTNLTKVKNEVLAHWYFNRKSSTHKAKL